MVIVAAAVDADEEEVSLKDDQLCEMPSCGPARLAHTEQFLVLLLLVVAPSLVDAILLQMTLQFG